MPNQTLRYLNWSDVSKEMNQSEAAGVRGTGIGCYFDDAFHNLLGLNGDPFQSLYHFTVGGPVDDSRLTTLPPYSHLDRG